MVIESCKLEDSENATEISTQGYQVIDARMCNEGLVGVWESAEFGCQTSRVT